MATVIALSKVKIALLKSNIIAVFKFNQQDDSDRPLILAWRSHYDDGNT
jgi:hypothetical protein